ncbi:MAG: SPOR domain-containing protein [Phycisphaerales bacterium]
MLLSLPLATAGCEGPGAGSQLDGSIAAYDASQFDVARMGALDVMRSAASPQREEAAYLAGMSAYRLRDIDDAERLFMTAAKSSDATVKGRSTAMLGVIRIDQGRSPDAAHYFATAAAMLPDRDEVRRAQELARDGGAAMNAQSNSGRDTLQVAPDTSEARYTIQVGVFTQKANAESAQRNAEATARQHGLGPVRIVTRADSRSNQTLYVVQFGSFASEATAQASRARIGRGDFIVAEAP